MALSVSTLQSRFFNFTGRVRTARLGFASGCHGLIWLKVGCFSGGADLLAQLRPGEDGLILTDGPRCATFLPMIWDSLPEPRAFLEQLRRKAGLAEDHWSERLMVSRYRAESFSEPPRSA
ncbi:MAG: hypothetical protein CSA74_10190 [Rhodobacterales bacterium]|nr:MAG: hypothetical protein CSA74_10190 [Rhodobacterales bacterium]